MAPPRKFTMKGKRGAASAANKAAAKPADTTQQELVREETPAKKPLTPLKFDAADEVESTRCALTARADALEAEAKRLDGLSKPKEAKGCRDEAARIRERLLTQVGAAQLTFNASENTAQAVARLISNEVDHRVRHHLRTSAKPAPGEKKEDAEARALERLDELVVAIGKVGEFTGAIATKYLIEAAERGLQAGQRNREADATSIAREALHAVEAELAAGRAA